MCNMLVQIQRREPISSYTARENNERRFTGSARGRESVRKVALGCATLQVPIGWVK